MTVVKKRVLRRKSRKANSPYRIHCENISGFDELVVYLYDEKDLLNPIFSFGFSGERLHYRKSIHFTAIEINGEWQINFIQIQPNS